MQKPAQTGKNGEERARCYLEERGYTILAANWRHGKAEIDLICRLEQLLVFVEVKARSGSGFGDPETFVSERKIELMQEAAEAYTDETGWEGDLRFDIIAIGPGERLEHFEDAFF